MIDIQELSGAEIYQLLEQIKVSYLKRDISFDEAVKQCNPVIREINDRGLVLAKKHGKRYSPISTGYVLR